MGDKLKDMFKMQQNNPLGGLGGLGGIKKNLPQLEIDDQQD
jgi:hypothetical protein